MGIGGYDVVVVGFALWFVIVGKWTLCCAFCMVGGVGVCMECR